MKESNMECVHYNVLVVDDEEQMRTLISRTLSQKGHRCVTAENGHEALNHIRETPFDAVITEARSPHA